MLLLLESFPVVVVLLVVVLLPVFPEGPGLDGLVVAELGVLVTEFKQFPIFYPPSSLSLSLSPLSLSSLDCNTRFSPPRPAPPPSATPSLQLPPPPAAFNLAPKDLKFDDFGAEQRVAPLAGRALV